MAYATFADVQARSFDDLSDNEALIDTRLTDAEMLIRSEIPDLDDKVTAGTLSKDAVVYVECEMLLRLIKNPEGFMQESDGGYSYMLNQNIASGALDLTATDRRLLGLGSGAFVIRPLLDIPCNDEFRGGW